MIRIVELFGVANLALGSRVATSRLQLEDEEKCAEYQDLDCGSTVKWAFDDGRHQRWAKTAYANMDAVSSVSFKEATVHDFQRLQYCGGIEKAKRCKLPPCECTSPPCDTCGSFTPPKEKVYDRHSGKGCFLGHGGSPLEDGFDEELPGWPSFEECQKACDGSFKCKAFTRGKGSSSTCWLRTKVNLEMCKDDSHLETFVRQHDPDEVVATCADYTDLKCGQKVAYNFHSGKRQSWAAKAYANMKVIAGLKYSKATINDFHHLQFCGGLKKARKCELPPCECSKPPCGSCGDFVAPPAPPPKRSSHHKLHSSKRGRAMGYALSDRWVGEHWCKAQPPASGWSLNKGCTAEKSLEVRVLSYNLFWWHLFGVRNGADRMAGRLVEKNGPWDFMGFQECDNLTRIVDDSRALETHAMYNGTSAVSNAWNKAKWKTLETGFKLVSEDHSSQWYGKRGVVWTRVQHFETRKNVFFMNYHGALPVGGSRDGGKCGNEATAYNILRVIGEHSQTGDSVILVGDFNSIKNSPLHKTLSKYMTPQYQGKSFNGVDNIYTNGCANLVSRKNLGNGGSDHDALGIVFRI